MPTPVVYPSAKQYVGFSKEVTMGTAVTPNTGTYPITEFEVEDKPEWLIDDALRGSMGTEFGMIQGPLHSEFSGSGPAFLDVLGNPLLNILGACDTSGPLSSVYRHEFALLNAGTAQPPSHTWMDWQGPVGAPSFSRMVPGSCLSELVIKGNPESTLIEHSFKGSGWPTQIYPTAEPVNAPSAMAPLGAWRTAITVGGVANLTIREWAWTISRGIAVQHTSQNSQNPFIIFRGPVTVSGSALVAKPADESINLLMLNNTQVPLVFTIDNGAAGAATANMVITCTVAAVDTSVINRGDAAVGYSITWKGIMNATDANTAGGGMSPINVVLENAVASY